MMWKGIDVSDNQGIIDWAQVAAVGVQFAILRSVRRSGKADYQFAANLAGCREHRIPVAVYKYTYAQTVGQAHTEARQVIDLLQSHDLTDTTIWWDVEDRDALQGLGRVQLTALIQAAQETVEAAGFRFGLYVGLYVYCEDWFDFKAFSCPLWVARYYKGYDAVQFGDTPDPQKIPQVGRDIWGWQHTSTGRVPGISGNVDLNVCYQDPAVSWGHTVPQYYLQEIWHGTSIARALESIGEDGSYQRRVQIAAVNGIQGYTGTAAQNTHMLNLLRTGQLRMP